MQHHPVIKLQLEASNEGTHQRIPQRNAETKSLVAGTKLSTVEEVCLEDIFRSEKAVVSIFIITKLLINCSTIYKFRNLRSVISEPAYIVCTLGISCKKNLCSELR